MGGDVTTSGAGCRYGRLATLLGIVSIGSMLAVPAEESAQGATHALLINGGSKPAANYQSHLHHLQDMVQLLEQRGLSRGRIHIFSADGEDEAADLAVREPPMAGFWLISGTTLGRSLKPKTEVTDTRWEGMTLRPATQEALRSWFAAAQKWLAPGDRLFMFVTDHGTENRDDPDNGAISLWKEKLTVQELNELVGGLRPGVQSVMVMSQCYSGTFASLIYGDGSAEPSGDVCGFFSTTRDQRAYGCYPEGRDRDRIGHAFHFIDALDHQSTTIAAHLEVLVADATPDVPVRTSDLYLERLVAREAETRGRELNHLVDDLLEKAWIDRAGWEPEIRLLDAIGERFGTFSPRSIAELETYAAELPPLIERMTTFADRWKSALIAVKQENLGSFVEDNPRWRDRLAPSAVERLDGEAKPALLAELLPQLESYAHGRTELWSRIETLRERAERASAARWRLETRRAALQRMRTVLIGIAGQVLIGQTMGGPAGNVPAERRAYERLVSCEAFEPGGSPASTSTEGASVDGVFPPLADEIRLLEELLPAWLGVRFRDVPKSLRSGRELETGAAFLLAIYPDSPAVAAGLEVGDIVIGPPGKPFLASGQIREWTMLSPQHTPLPLAAIRPAIDAKDDRSFVATLTLGPYPIKWPELPGPPKVGAPAPVLPPSLRPVGDLELPDLSGRSHLLFFWATWCEPCKAAVPEVLALAEARELPVIAISDEDAATVAGFLEQRETAFFERVAVDPLRRSFVAHGVSGTPTLVLIDEQGVVRHRQVGYRPAEGLTVEGWSWPGR